MKKTKVDNAIIMAAGTSSRFAPLSYDKPKGLIKVLGEVLIERQINQLQQAGIKDITIVTGYLGEQFEYLKDKFSVKIIHNQDYYRYNNTSSLILVLDKLKNTYICSSDNYFIKNPFNLYEDKSFYPVKISKDETNEYYVNFNQDLKITSVNFDGGEYYMMGHVFFDEKTSQTFSKILKREYKRDDVKLMLWEKLYLEFIDEMDLYIKIDNLDIIQEFDSFEELRVFDNSYLNYTENKYLNFIAQNLNVKVSNIKNVREIEDSENSQSFSFDCLNLKYKFYKNNEKLKVVQIKSWSIWSAFYVLIKL